MITIDVEVMNILGVLCAVPESLSKGSSIPGRLFSKRFKAKAKMGIIHSRETLSAFKLHVSGVVDRVKSNEDPSAKLEKWSKYNTEE